MISLKPAHNGPLAYDHVIGTGGIGSGMFFSLTGNHTLGRNESRMATLLPAKDFCKQHIIMHYIAVLLGAKPNGKFQSFPIGKVGNDETGHLLIEKMKAVGMDTAAVTVCSGHSTLFSVCYQYPDFSGGNITTENSASNQVSADDITRFFEEFTMGGEREIILAAPEVPMDARITLLRHGRQRGSLNVASVLSGETEAFRKQQGFEMADLLFVNRDEARSISNFTDDTAPIETIVEKCISELTPINPEINLLITDGKNGSYGYADGHLEHLPALPVPVISSAGAGDAFLAGTLAGICCRLPLTKGEDDSHFSSTPLKSAMELGTLLSALSVTSADTIHAGADASLLYAFAMDRDLVFDTAFLAMFEKVRPEKKS